MDPYERVTFSQVEIYERVGKSVIVVCKKGPKGLTDEFYGYKKSRKPSGFGIDSYLKDGAWFERGTICPWKLHKRGTSFMKNRV